MSDWLDRQKRRVEGMRSTGAQADLTPGPEATDDLSGISYLDRVGRRAKEKLTHERTIRKVKWGGIWGAIAAGAAALASALDPALFAGLGPWGAPIAAAASIAVQFVASYITGTTEEDLPTEIKEALKMADVESKAQEASTIDEVKEVVEEIFDDEGDMDIAVEKLNKLIDVPGMSEEQEAWAIRGFLGGLVQGYHMLG